jgi:hypothetical protein
MDVEVIKVDGLRFRDPSRFLSSAIARAFASAIRAGSQGPQSVVANPRTMTDTSRSN